MMRNRSFDHPLRSVLVIVLALGIGFTFAGLPTRIDPRGGSGTPVVGPAASRPGLLHAFVVDVDPASVFASKATPVLGEANFGPFGAPATLNLYVLTVYDRARLGSAPFDQRLRLILPDGGLYENRLTPVDPAAAAGKTVVREDIAPHPVAVAVPGRMLRLARALPSGRISPDAMRDASYTTETFPVSGTWITEHNLYGEWTAVVTMERNGAVLGESRTTFRITNSN